MEWIKSKILALKHILLWNKTKEDLKMNMKKIKSFVKSHKTEIAIGTGIVVGTVLFVLTKNLIF